MFTVDVGSASRQELREIRTELDPVLLRQIDGRGPAVNIPARTIALSLAVYFLEAEITSLLGLDQKLRRAEAQKLIGATPFQRSENSPVVSDSTVRSALDGWDPELIRIFSSWLYESLEEKDLLGLTLQSDRNLNVGLVDSSSFGNCYCNCIMAVADANTFALDLEGHDRFSRGEELAAAERLIERWKHRFELLFFDGLYLKERFFKQLRGNNTADMLVKYPIKSDREKEFPWPLEQADYLIKKGLRESGSIEDERFDEPVRFRRVTVQDRGHEFVIDRFVLEAEEKEDFYTATTRLNLSSNDTWELARGRWSIENNGFRALSLQNDSKDQQPEGGPKLPPEVKYTLLFWLLLFQSFFRLLEEKCVSEDERKNVKVTERWLFGCLRKYVEALFNSYRDPP
ncbi:hypothetical protein K9M06_05765 [Candidatus Bipolaricaulota bacterium]|nr:hypothetical protein [Candidatus Bipolaricaulota bacterium]